MAHAKGKIALPVGKTIYLARWFIFKPGMGKQNCVERGLPIIDLRVLCNDDADFANPIEPSAIGGQKIAQAIVEMMDANGVHARKTIVYS